LSIALFGQDAQVESIQGFQSSALEVIQLTRFLQMLGASAFANCNQLAIVYFDEPVSPRKLNLNRPGPVSLRCEEQKLMWLREELSSSPPVNRSTPIWLATIPDRRFVIPLSRELGPRPWSRFKCMPRKPERPIEGPV
jgi:hypothetical protein